MTSIRNEHINVTKFLLSKGCNINLPLNDNSIPSPLHLFLLYNNILSIESNTIVLEQLITPNNLNKRVENISINGLTPLLIASLYYDEHIINLLIKKGAKNKKDNYGNTPLLMTLNYLNHGNRNIDLAKHFINNNKYINDCNIFLH